MSPVNVRVEVVRVTGRCDAGFRAGETFAFDGSRLVPERGEARDCPVVGALFGGNLGRLRLRAPLCLSCPDPGTGAGGNVLFRVWIRSGEGVQATGGRTAAGRAEAVAGETPPLRAEAVEVLGVCPAGLSVGEEFPVGGAGADGLTVTPGAVRPVCVWAAGAFAPTVWQLRAGSRFFGHASCPGCTIDPAHENRVVFLLGHADKWDLCRLISEYLRLRRDHGEPPSAAALSTRAMAHQEGGDFAAAAEAMRQAVEALRWHFSERKDQRP